MATLVKSVRYPIFSSGVEIELFKYRESDELYFTHELISSTSFVVPNSSREVLSKTLPTHFLQGYLGIFPWTVKTTRNENYLEIIETDYKKFDGTIEEMLLLDEFKKARRENELDSSKKNKLIVDILSVLDPDNIHGFLINRDDKNSVRAYFDILNVLGKNISYEEISQMIQQQYDGLDTFNSEINLYNN